MIEKILLSGNEAFARGAYEAGVMIGTGYPGTPSTEILENLVRYEGVYTQWSPNEKVALEVGAGACWGGARCIVTMKHVGLNVAADPLMTLSYIGVRGGLALIVCDDPGMYSSQNEQDSRHYARLGKIPMLEPSDSQEAKDFVSLAMHISEQFGTPVMIRSNTRISHSRSLVILGERHERNFKPFFEKAPKRFVTVPIYARQMKISLEKRFEALREFSDTCHLNRIIEGKDDLGIITSSISYQYAKETFGDASILKLGMSYPFPDNLIREFAQRVKRILVVEELDAFLEEHCLALGVKVEGIKHRPAYGELDLDELEGMKRSFQPAAPMIFMNIEEVNREEIDNKNGNSDTDKGGVKEDAREKMPVQLPPRPPVLCPGCPHRGLFFELHKINPVIIGDIGCYSLAVFPPLEALDSILCMGAGVSSALGLEKSGTQQKVVGVVGDSTFFHSGMTGLLDIAYNKGRVTILVLDNSTTAMTGHQDHPGTGRTLKGEETKRADIEAIARAFGINLIYKIDPYNLKEVRKTLKEAIEADEPAVVVSTRPCILIERGQIKKPLTFFDDLCVGCGACLNLGCPGLEIVRDKEGGKRFKVRINQVLCVGCGLCSQVCPKGAFK